MTTTERLMAAHRAAMEAMRDSWQCAADTDAWLAACERLGAAEAAFRAYVDSLSSTLEAPADWVLMRQAIGNLRVFITGMDENNWRDMRLNAERQLDSLSRLIKGGSDATPVK